VLVLLFGAYALVDGAFGIVAAIRGSSERRWLLLAEGIIGVLAGLIAFVWPGLIALALLYVIAFWAVFTGILRIVTAVSLRWEIQHGLLLVLSDVLSVLFGMVLPPYRSGPARVRVAYRHSRAGVRELAYHLSI
jgi:uncharacterized membrane protein HdeD (DUF308 family)